MATFQCGALGKTLSGGDSVMKIVVMTSVHPRYDTRIFIKECQTLAKHYDVSLVVADGKGDEIKNGVHIYDAGLRESSRIKRGTQTVKAIYEKALSLNGDIYHFHDPELLKTVSKLKKHGKKVIYDVHEDVEVDILTKEWIPKSLRKFISKSFWMYECKQAKKVDAVLTATPYICDKFKKINPNTIDINNYPILSELYSEKLDWSMKKDQVCYVGGLSVVRGIKEIVIAANALGLIRLVIGGQFDTHVLEQEVKSESSVNVQYLGFLDRPQVAETYKNSVAGLVTLHPILNYLDSLPVKMFEYMSAGIPVIASNFPLWRDIIEGNQCGLCVDPLDPQQIATAIATLVQDKALAQQLGDNGRRAVEEKYNWSIEAEKLLSLYRGLL